MSTTRLVEWACGGLLAPAPQRILAIDPGTRVMGYAILQGDGRQSPVPLVAGAERLLAIHDPLVRLNLIHQKLLELIHAYHPTVAAIESPFYGKNAQSMLKLGRAQGVAIQAMLQEGLKVQEYAPTKVKLSLTGCGQASKEQLKNILQQLFPDVPIMQLRYLDATDALAIAYCHYYEGRTVGHTGKTTWADFVKRNPERIRQ